MNRRARQYSTVNAFHQVQDNFLAYEDQFSQNMAALDSSQEGDISRDHIRNVSNDDGTPAQNYCLEKDAGRILRVKRRTYVPGTA